MSLIERRWIVSTGELWLPDGSPTSKPDPETEDWVVLAEDYDALADQLAGAVASLAVIRSALDDLEHAPFRAQALADLPDIIRAAIEGQ
jgi:hypothetical protein